MMTYGNPLKSSKFEHGRSKLVQRLGDSTLQVAQAFDAGGKILVIGGKIFKTGAKLGSIDVAKGQS